MFESTQTSTPPSAQSHIPTGHKAARPPPPPAPSSLNLRHTLAYVEKTGALFSSYNPASRPTPHSIEAQAPRTSASLTSGPHDRPGRRPPINAWAPHVRAPRRSRPKVQGPGLPFSKATGRRAPDFQVRLEAR